MPASGFPTPDTPEQEIGFVCKPIFVPDLDGMWEVLYGQIAELTRAYYWKKVGTMEPDEAAFLWARALGKTDADAFCADEESDDCIEQPTNYGQITYLPKDPYTGVGDDTGYLLPPFIRFGDILPDMLLGFAESLTGYQPNDILVLLGSLPIGIDFDEILEALENGLPRFQIAVQGKGRVLLHLLMVPFGGRAVVSVDNEISVVDLIAGSVTDDYITVELEADHSSIPPEKDIEHIEEIKINDDGEHIIYVQFVPVINDALIPLNFGGGLRSVEICLDDEEDWMIDCEFVQNCIENSGANEVAAAQDAITWVQMETLTQAHLDEIAAGYTGDPSDSFPAIPTGVPDADQQLALCNAIQGWVYLYAEVKKGKIRNQNVLQQTWNAILDALKSAYELVNGMLGMVLPVELWGCVADNQEAIDALSDIAALNEVACCLYNYLKTRAFTETNISDAFVGCFDTMSPTANLVHCMMMTDAQEDFNIYLSFMEVYAYKLQYQLAGEVYENCICETGYSYLEFDFTVDDFGFTGTGTWTDGVGWVGADVAIASGYTRNQVEIAKAVDIADYEVYAVGIHVIRSGGESHGANTITADARNSVDDTSTGGGYNFAGNGDFKKTFTGAAIMVDSLNLFNRVRGQTIADPTATVVKARFWLTPDSPVTGTPHSNPPIGLPPNGSTDEVYWT